MAVDDRFTSIKDLRPGMKNVTCVFIVVDRGTTNQIKDGSIVRKCRVADKTGSICFSLWNEQAEAIESGDILRLVKGYASLWKGTLMLYSGKFGHLEKIGEFTMVFSEVPDMSDASHDFIQQYQKEKGLQDGRGGYHGNRNGSNYSVSQGGDRDHHHSGGSGQSTSGQPGEGKRRYTSPPTGDYRPSPPHTYPSPHPHSSQQAPAATSSSHMHPAYSHSMSQPPVGGPHGENYLSQNLVPSGGPHRTQMARQDMGGHRYQPYSVRR